ncbi:unnamed protein product [Calicophoron daubneyi]|uniref:Uncharacterized protein n=1 Tax=Calicophoron daubneyi TaxID=300641 RepID=A0AAV2T904_CALDB
MERVFKPSVRGLRFRPFRRPATAIGYNELDDGTFKITNLSCKNYRKLRWDMPIRISPPAAKSVVSIPIKILTGRSRNAVFARKVDYYRSIDAVHFSDQSRVLEGYKSRVNQLREQRLRLLGDVCYCINHPGHYEVLRERMKEQYETAEEAKCKARKIRCKTAPETPTRSLDPVVKLPPINQTSLYLNKLDTSQTSQDELTSLNSAETLPTESAQSLYRKAEFILNSSSELPTPNTQRPKVPLFYRRRGLSFTKVTASDE